jgi:hypothetical protein
MCALFQDRLTDWPSVGQTQTQPRWVLYSNPDWPTDRRSVRLRLSPEKSSGESSTDRHCRTDSLEVRVKASDENKKTRLLFICNRFVKWIVVTQKRKGPIKGSVKPASRNYLSRYPGNTWQYLLAQMTRLCWKKNKAFCIIFLILLMGKNSI